MSGVCGAVAEKMNEPLSHVELVSGTVDLRDDDMLEHVIHEALQEGRQVVDLTGRVRRTVAVAGTHLGNDCTCHPGRNEVCWGYRACVKNTCPRCQEIITTKSKSMTAGCRMNGDAYGWTYLTCQNCGLVQKDG